MEILNALLEVRKKVNPVGKNGKNTFHNYSYTMADDVVAEIKPLVDEAGILPIPTQVKDITFTKDGQVQNFTQLYRLYCVKDFSFVDAEIRAAGEDKGDKTPYKANTGALKYLFMQVFLLRTDGDPENDSKDKGNREPKKIEGMKAAGGQINTDYHSLFKNCTTKEQLKKVWDDNSYLHNNPLFKVAASEKKHELESKQAA